MGYYRSSNDRCLVVFALPVILAWYVVKFALAICACALVVPVRIIWLLFTIPVNIFTGEDHTADWEDSDFLASVWQLFFPAK